jgi:hypothetical protein
MRFLPAMQRLDLEPERPPARAASRGFLSRHRKLAGAAAAAVSTAALGVVVPQLVGSVEHRIKPPPVLRAQSIVDVARFRSDAPHVPEFVIPRVASAVPKPPDAGAAPNPYDPHHADDIEPARYAWAHELGGVDAGETLVRVSISGARPAATQLQQLRAKILRCRPPLHGTLVTYLGLGSGMGARYFAIDLDHDSPPAQYVDAKGQIKDDQPFPLRVTDADQEVFDVSATVTRRDCDWELLLDWTAGSKSGTTVITDHGRPFRTTSGGTADGPAPGVNRAVWDLVEQHWTTV